MRSHEVVAKTADEAVEEILRVMNVNIDEVDIEIEEEQGKGFFGLFAKKEVRVRATLKEENTSSISDVKGKENVVSREPKVFENSEESIKIIKDFLKLMSESIERDIEVSVKEFGENIVIDVKGEDLSMLIGRHGKTLEAIRYLLSLMINKDKDSFRRIIFDVEGYRKKRDNSLERLARNIATRVIKTKEEVKLDPMNPYERRIVHSTLQRNRLVTTRSEGDEPYRSVVVFLK
ncbi:MAG: hypothetical protein CSB15_00400 [Clostridiales bacterium]|nr:MAG: hypothetical protein CSB15_00400 [Clostridiales bacterium]